MKILLTAINAKYIHSNLAVYNLRAYAAHYAKGMTASDTVEIGEYTINNQMEDILEGIYKAKPDVLMFSCYIWNIAYVEELAEEFHKLRPEVPIWVGGPEVSYETESFLRCHPQITGVMIGEGEKTFCELAEYYAGEIRSNKEAKEIKEIQTIKQSVNLGEIAGIAYRNEEEIVFTAPREMLDLSDIPFCYDEAGDFKNRIIYYESSRGCPFSCSYCLSSVEKQLRFRNTELVKKELQFFIDREVPQVKFVDRTFNCNHAHAMEIWSYIKEHDNGITNFHFEISADLLKEEELALIGTMRPGLIQLEIGVQSTNGATIKEIHRTMQLERLKEVVREVQKHENIHEHLDLIAGLPFEDYDIFAKSFDEIYELRPNQLQLGFLKVLKGSYMYEHAKEYEIAYHSRPPYEVLKTKWLPYDDVLKIRQVEEMLEVYYNSGQFEVTMKVLGVLFKSAFFLFQDLGKFYEKKGYFGMSHARIRRSEILLEFVEETFSADTEKENLQEVQNLCEISDIIKESLIFDLYYRENCKSRPAWAKDLSTWKQVTRIYCKNGKQSHVECFSYRFPDKGERVLKELPERAEKPLYALFDYTDRDPLDHQAKVTWIMEDENAGLCSN
ncbi:B12-binding domain-containing radical SAM protein [Roseburia rectibacter]|uniref:B12-binding domain-containing radical SAM protein n=1 Tax=Roseburia rectibacter TaxID=2763062 RepID=UPI00164CCFA8|nr:B12-binding domain-containing radical SAM protein [Roseburia rectibacter]UMZ00843.1 B12-binding domain-containing radical SAM protein [Roseburia rectibacter]